MTGFLKIDRLTKGTGHLLYRLGVPAEIRAKIVGDTTHVLQTHYTQIDSGMIRKAIGDFSRALGERRVVGV